MKILIASAVVLCLVAVSYPVLSNSSVKEDSQEMTDNETGQTEGCKSDDESKPSNPTEIVVVEEEDIDGDEMEDSDDPADAFSIQEIDDRIFARIKGKSYKNDCTVPLSELRYLTIPHYDIDGNIKMGELICNVGIANDLIEIFQTLFDAKYPIERMVLIDEYGADDRTSMRANNTSSFNYRVVAGSTKLSNHARGLAIDVNPLYNPYVKKQKDGSLYVSPKEGTKYANRKADFPYKIDENDLLYKEFIKHGFTWGGAWKTMQDYQHFEKKLP